MTLQEYLEKNNISAQDFAKQIGVSRITIFRAKRGAYPKMHLEIAISIHRATKGTVSFEEICYGR